MHRDRLPFCPSEASFREVVQSITRGRLGLVLVGNPAALSGIITDGDIRRAFERHPNPMNLMASEIMTAHPQTIAATERYAKAEELMRDRRIHALIALDGAGLVCGVVQWLRNEPLVLSGRPSVVAPALA